MLKYKVVRKKDTVVVAIMPHKDGSGYGFVNLTKCHICPCRFNTIEDAIMDMENDPKVISFEKIEDEEVKSDGSSLC